MEAPTAVRPPGRSAEGSRAITPFYIAAQVIAYLSFILGWLRGGHPERFGAGVLVFDYLLTGIVVHRSIVGAQAIEVASESTVMLVFIWLAVTSDRWWPLVAAAALTLCVMMHGLEWVIPGLSRYAVESAQLGLWIVVGLALIAGVGERWLAREPRAGATAVWRRRRGRP